MMDREPEELQFLGAFGIIKEAFKILRSCGRLLTSVTLTLVLPLSFVILGHTLVSVPLLHKINANERELQLEAGTAAGDRTLGRLSSEWTEVFALKVGYFVFLLAFSLLSAAAVVYTVACMYTAKEVSYGKVMSVVPKVWRRLMVTFLWFFAIMIAYNTAFVFAVLFLILAVGLNNLYSGAFIVGLTILVIVFFAVHVYISAVWHLASVISVLEDKYGVGAMQKSKDLIKGKRVSAFALILIYFLFSGVIGFGFGVTVVHGDRIGVGFASRVGYAILLTALLCCVNLIGLLMQSVFYFVCKSYHHESIDKSSLSDHLEVYLGEYVPLKSNIQLENL